MTNKALPRMKSVRNVSTIVMAYVSNNSISVGELPLLITSVHQAVHSLSTGVAKAPPEKVAPQVPATSVRKSLTPDNLVCLECGKSFVSIKRHLDSSHDLTPEKYRAKWGLPSTYPMVTVKYSATRSELAKDLKLGHKAKRPANKKKKLKETA